MSEPRLAAAAGPRIGMIRFALRLARRELRGGTRGLRIYLGCLVIGVAAIAGIGSLAASVAAGIRADARSLLGGDVAARLLYRPADPAERRFLAASGTLSEVATLRAMARTSDNRRQSLIALKAVDRAYPLYGRVALTPFQPLAAALARRGGMFGAVVDPKLLGRLGLAVGDTVRIGAASFRVRATMASVPDASLRGLIFGPPVIISQAGLAATGLIQPGALVAYHYRLRLPPDTSPAAWAKRARAAFPEAGWRIRTPADASPGLKRLLARVSMFLSLVGLTALLVGGVGIGNAVRAYIGARTATIATLKCLGAPSWVIVTAYLLVIVMMAIAGLVAALALGALLPIAVLPLVSGVLPIAARPGFYPMPLGLAALFGLLTVLVFSPAPLAAIGRIPAGALFRETAAPARRQPPPLALGASALAALALAALAVLSAPDRPIALWFVAIAVVVFVLLWAAGTGLVFLAKRLGRPRQPVLRLALANLWRPGAPTVQVVLSLGLGLTVLVAIALVEGNLQRQIAARLPAQAPAFFFIDIQPSQLSGFEAAVRATPQARFEQVPMLRGRITRLDGVPIEQAIKQGRVGPGARWAVDSDRGLTYAKHLPDGSRIAAGKWWPADYHGPPLVSFAADLAHEMGLKVGDTLSVNLLGRTITARIASLRDIDWARLGINFVMVFSPGVLEGAPQTHLAAVYLPPSEANALVRRITARFPNVSAIPVRAALATVARIVGTIGAAVRAMALVTLAVGALVLGGALAAGQQRRVYDAVLLKVLGATRRAVAAALLIEHALLGTLAALVAAGLGTLAAYFLVARVMNIAWVFLPWPVAGSEIVAVLLALTLGSAGIWRALGASPAAYLRNE